VYHGGGRVDEGVLVKTFTEHGYSKVTDFEKCPRFYMYRWEPGWKLTPRKTNVNTLFGTTFHAARAAWYESGKQLSEAFEAIKSVLTDYLGADDFDVGDFAMYACDAITAYADKYQDDDLVRTASEVAFDTEIGGFPLTGRLDNIIVVDGMVWVEEVKTTGLSIPTFLRSMHVDGKTTAYIWAARKLADERVQGAYLDVCYKKRNKSGFEFVRDVSPRTSDFLQQWEHDTIRKLEAIRQARESGDWIHNYTSCFNMYGVCPYLDLCRFGERPELVATFNKQEEGGDTGEVVRGTDSGE
jgi:hypothetical protein